VVVFHSGRVFVDPPNAELAAALGFGTKPAAETYEMVIIGAGPAGLAAAVYGAAEGLRTLVVEPQVVGGRAGTSPQIRNYLADRYEAWAQAVEATHPRTAGALRTVADSYRDEGRRNDEEARRFLEGLDLWRLRRHDLHALPAQSQRCYAIPDPELPQGPQSGRVISPPVGA
jgi:glycine/D-amino acid oxidase-like deaminating enzyme